MEAIMYRMDVLEKLEKGHISVNKAISMLKHPPKPKPLPKGNILIIKVRDKDKKLYIPIPLFLINLFFLLGKLGIKVAVKFANNEDLRKVNGIVKYIDYRHIRKLVNSLRICKSTGLVEVQEGDSTVIISMI